MSSIQPYYALALQTRIGTVNHCKTRKEARGEMLATIARIGGEIAAAKRFNGADTLLFVLPEYFLSGFPMGEGLRDWGEKAALAPDGDEYGALAQIARDNAIYLSGNAYELDVHFEGLYFQTSFIIDPQGEVILRYRRLNSMFAPTPHDVWDKYVDIYGLEGVFPVVRSAIGNLACIASEEILYPEIARALAMRGAEVFLHSTGEIGNIHDTPKTIAKRARAFENMAYVVAANTGGMEKHVLPDASTDGRSAVIDHRGIVLAESGWGATMTACAVIDIGALRHARARPGMSNYLARQRFEVFAQTYAELGSQSANSLMRDGSHFVPERAHFIEAQAAALARLKKNDVI